MWRADAEFEDGGVHRVAIKRVLPNLGQPLFRAMFEDEARLGMLLNHPNIVRVYDARDVGGTFIMVMELVEGDSLKGLLERAHQRGACMPVGAALYVARELSAALDYVHRAQDGEGNHLGIIHRDVSPHNILLGRDGAVKLTDFGLADARMHETARSEELVGGKLGYLAPELVLQKGNDYRIDLFAIGIVLWEMLGGRRLFLRDTDVETVRAVAQCQVPSLCTINPSVPKQVDDVVQMILNPNPDQRLGGARRVYESLDLLLRRIDREVSHRDISLLVALHMAQRDSKKREERLDLGFGELLAQELDEFVARDGGDAPLDPLDFGASVRSGVRTRPTKEKP